MHLHMSLWLLLLKPW
jgi:actin-related protein